MTFLRYSLFFTIVLNLIGLSHAQPTPAEMRTALEHKWQAEGVPLIPHRPSYFFPFTYNTTPHPTSRHRKQHKEAKFQLSFKALLSENLFKNRANFYFGYTQLSLWQIYDQERSAPFRDTNFEPELFLTFDGTTDAGALDLRRFDIGITHQSNGVSRPDSRSWNRVYAQFLFDTEFISINAKPWIRIPDSAKRDDNDDIEKYLGYGELTFSVLVRKHLLSVMLRNNLRADNNKGAIQVDYSFALTRTITGLAQMFSGYGETLIDYNQPVDRYSIGISLGYGNRN